MQILNTYIGQSYYIKICKVKEKKYHSGVHVHLEKSEMGHTHFTFASNYFITEKEMFKPAFVRTKFCFFFFNFFLELIKKGPTEFLSSASNDAYRNNKHDKFKTLKCIIIFSIYMKVVFVRWHSHVFLLVCCALLKVFMVPWRK